jgi:hypothetical protein
MIDMMANINKPALPHQRKANNVAEKLTTISKNQIISLK